MSKTTLGQLHWREKQVVEFLLENPDAHDKEIADHLGLAVHTTKIYLGRAMANYGVTTRTGLIAKAIREEFVAA